jgi:ankyrin repeat protein
MDFPQSRRVSDPPAMDEPEVDFKRFLSYAATAGNLEEFAKLLAAGAEIPADLTGCEQAEWLIGAVKSDQAQDFLELLLKAGLNPASVYDRIGDAYQSNAFIAAAERGRIDLMEMLIKAGADPHWKSPSGTNAAGEILSCLLSQDHQHATLDLHGVKQWLDDHGVRFDPSCEDSQRKLQYAASGPYSWPKVPTLIHLGIDPTVLKWTPFMMKVAMGTATIQDALEMPIEELTWSDCWQRTPFLFAVVAGRKDLAEILLERGSDLLERGRCGASALHLAPVYLKEWLVHRGIPVDIHDDFQHTPLRGAGADAARCLLSLGADPNAIDRNGYRVIHDADDLETIQLLFEAGADLNAVSGGGTWPLSDACRAGDCKLVSFLLKNGAIVDLKSSGETAIHAAVVSDSIECVELLLDAGATINALDVDGWTCLWYAKSLNMARCLLDKGADPRIADMFGDLPETWVSLEISRLFRQRRLAY